jgi:hypothetical protein
MRHMGWMFDALDLENDAGNRHRLDRAIRRALEMTADAPCADVWTYLKAMSDEERFELLELVEKELAE